MATLIDNAPDLDCADTRTGLRALMKVYRITNEFNRSKFVLFCAGLTGNNTGKTKDLKYINLVAALTKAAQEQKAEIRPLKAANDNQISEVTHLRTHIGALEREIPVCTAQN